ncbi:hypothetical protein EJB05_11820, partial [Eragrostis curvula]
MGHHIVRSMPGNEENPDFPTTQGKYVGIFFCWLLGNGCLVGFNSMLTMEDYFVYVFPDYHPTRLITLAYLPFVLCTTALFTYHEAKINTRARILAGYTLFFLGSLALIILDVATSGRGGAATFAGVCTISAVFGIADGHVEGAMAGDLSLMCPEFIQSFWAGLAASGVITSALRLVTKKAFDHSRDGLRKGAMLFASISCIGPEQNALGNLLVLSLLAGITFGDLLDWLWLIGKSKDYGHAGCQRRGTPGHSRGKRFDGGPHY